MTYRHLFFDLDHTLWDFETNAKNTMQQLYGHFALKDIGINDFDEFYKQYSIHNQKLWQRYHNGFIKSDELRWKRVWHTLLDFKIGDEKLAKEMSAHFLDLLPNRTALFPYAVEILNYLKAKGYRLHLITNGFETVQHSKLKYSGLTDFFENVITSEGSNSIKPNKEIFEFALNKAGATAKESLMIGDNLEADIQGAMNAGIDQVFVNHINEQTELKPTYTIYKLQELEDIL
ncbi:YjjG family noncanonical pyrimidine nucleotidase [Chitinophagaceae bacterium 26-R-25]|nr:YjjG family noncanonical pyrimidine nucleotidase [Chitinophagaceae bacterium 26-R-25]